MRAFAAELFGTFALIFAGTGAIVIHDTYGSVTHVGIAMTFGLIVMAMIYTVGDVSGCHLNPAVTVGLFVAGLFPGRRVAVYLFAQALGAFMASGVLRLLFPAHATLGATLPAGLPMQSFVLELILTLILMVTVLSLGRSSTGARPLAGLVVGAVIALEAMFAGPVSGASMNPIRSLSPAVVSGRLEHLWIYLTAPVLGALLAIPIAFLIHGPAPVTAPAEETR